MNRSIRVLEYSAKKCDESEATYLAKAAEASTQGRHRVASRYRQKAESAHRQAEKCRHDAQRLRDKAKLDSRGKKERGVVAGSATGAEALDQEAARADRETSQSESEGADWTSLLDGFDGLA